MKITPTILITDNLFVQDKHVKQLKTAGFAVERLDKPKATENELIDALKGKSGYILGGIEQVTDKVIDAADQLKVIAFTGSGYTGHIPAHELATKKGIAITNSPDSVTSAVAEYTLTLMLAMSRDVLEFGRTGQRSFGTIISLLESTVGIIGLGRIGQRVAKMLKGIGVKNVVYYSRTRKKELENELGIKYLPLKRLLKTSDVVTLHSSKEAGEHYIGKTELDLMKKGALLVSVSYPEAVDPKALLEQLESGRLRAAFDAPPVNHEAFSKLPLGVWFTSNAMTAFNTVDSIKGMSDAATSSIIKILKTGDDEYLVNPEYKNYRSEYSHNR